MLEFLCVNYLKLIAHFLLKAKVSQLHSGGFILERQHFAIGQARKWYVYSRIDHHYDEVIR